MSDTQGASEVAPASVVEQPNADKAEALPKDDATVRLESTNKRLLEESKANKARNKELQDRLEKIENDALIKKENYKEYNDKLLVKVQEAEEKVKNIKVKALEKALDFEIAKYAPDAYKFDMVKQALPRDMLEAIEDGDDLQVTGVKEAIEKVRTENAFLFKQKSVPAQANGKPMPSTTGGARSLDKLNPGELASLLAGRKL